MNLYPREGTWLTLRFRAIWVIAGEFLNKHFGMTLTGQSRTLSPGCRGGMVVIPDT